MKLEAHIKRQIKEHSLRESPRECCGLIVRDEKKSFAYKSSNNSPNPEHHFAINPADYVKASKLGEITAVYHSHLKGCLFSKADRITSQSHNIVYVLYCLEDNSITQYDPSLEFNSYVGREFRWMSSDCFTLARDFYEKELNIKIRNYPRGERWKDEYGELFDKFFKKENFKEVKNLKKFDTILFKNKKNGFSIHCAIYLGGGLILHQPRNSISRIDEYNRYKNLTSKILRHKSHE